MNERLHELAIECWKAEEENARRLAGRTNLLLGISAAVVTVAGPNLRPICLAVRDFETGWCRFGFLAAVALALATFVFAFGRVIYVPRTNDRAPASEGLFFPEGDEVGATHLPNEAAEEYAFYAIYESAKDLRAQNSDVAARIDVTQQALILSLALIGAAGLAYIAGTALDSVSGS